MPDAGPKFSEGLLDELDKALLDTPQSSSSGSLPVKIPQNRKLSKIGKAESVMMPALNKFSSSDSENELLKKRRRNSGRLSIRVA